MLRSRSACVIEVGGGLCLCTAGRRASPGFWPAWSFQSISSAAVFILGDRGDCVSLKARPLPQPECEMLRLGDAGLLLFVGPV